MKNERLEIRLNKKDKEKIVRNAKKTGLSISVFVREKCLGNDIKSAPPEEFWELLKCLYSFYNDLNLEKQEQLKGIILKLERMM